MFHDVEEISKYVLPSARAGLILLKSGHLMIVAIM